LIFLKIEDFLFVAPVQPKNFQVQKLVKFFFFQDKKENFFSFQNMFIKNLKSVN